MAVSDWRAWTDQQETNSNTQFPGQAAITDLLTPSAGIPPWNGTPTYVAPVDPFAGWNAQQETRSGTQRPSVQGQT